MTVTKSRSTILLRQVAQKKGRANVIEFKEILSEDLIKTLYEKRKDSILNQIQSDSKELDELLEKSKKGYKNILIAIDNVPDAFVKTKEFIKQTVDLQLENANCINQYNNEQFYTIGFYDAINLIIKSLQR